MTRLTGKLAVLVAELRRRKVAQVSVAYAALTWLLMQVADLALEVFDCFARVLEARSGSDHPAPRQKCGIGCTLKQSRRLPGRRPLWWPINNDSDH